MGFLDKIMGKDEPAPTEVREPNPDANPGPKLAFEPMITTFPMTLVMRVRSTQYEKLTGPWLAFQVTKIEDYYGAKRDILGKFRVQFGFYRTPAGKQIVRWNTRTWDNLVPMLGIEKKKDP